MAIKLAVIISGKGSNLQALIDACFNTDYPASISLVISDNPNAQGLERASAADIKTVIIDKKKHFTPESFDQEMTAVINLYGAELICLAGYMRLLTPQFVTDWHNKIINIHPSLLPAFKGLNVHSRALKRGVMFSGCTVHFVRTSIDSGPILIQSAVPVLSNDSVKTLAARILKQEHIIYPKAVRWIAENRVEIIKENIRLNGETHLPAAVINPNN